MLYYFYIQRAKHAHREDHPNGDQHRRWFKSSQSWTEIRFAFIGATNFDHAWFPYPTAQPQPKLSIARWIAHQPWRSIWFGAGSRSSFIGIETRIQLFKDHRAEGNGSIQHRHRGGGDHRFATRAQGNTVVKWHFARTRD